MRAALMLSTGAATIRRQDAHNRFVEAHVLLRNFILASQLDKVRPQFPDARAHLMSPFWWRGLSILDEALRITNVAIHSNLLLFVVISLNIFLGS